MIAEFEQRAAGFITYQLDHQTATGQVTFLAVLPERQNRGIGTRLTKLAL